MFKWLKCARASISAEEFFIDSVNFHTKIEDKTEEYLEVLAVSSLFETARIKKMPEHYVSWMIEGMGDHNKLKPFFNLPTDPFAKEMLAKGFGEMYIYYISARVDETHPIAAVQKAVQEWEKDHGYLINEINNVDIDT